jgi:hypothetical protein
MAPVASTTMGTAGPGSRSPGVARKKRWNSFCGNRRDDTAFASYLHPVGVGLYGEPWPSKERQRTGLLLPRFGATLLCSPPGIPISHCRRACVAASGKMPRGVQVRGGAGVWRQAVTEKLDVTPEKTRTLPIGRRELLSLEKVTTLLGRSPSSTQISVWLTFGLSRDAT